MLHFWIVLAAFLLILEISTERDKLFNLNFHQSDYQVDVEWGETVRFNKRYVQEFRAVAFKFNRSCTATNITFRYHIDVLNELEVVIQAYKFVSNEYRIFPAIRFEVNLCHAIAKNFAGLQGWVKCGNFTGCPFLKERWYHTCNFVLDKSKLPPLVPSGRYKFELQALFRNEEIWVVNEYLKIYREFDKK